MMDEHGIEARVYTQGAASTKTGKAACVFIAVNPEGRIVDAHAGYEEFMTPLEADLKAISLALDSLHEGGYRHVAVTTNSILAEQILNRKLNAKKLGATTLIEKIRGQVKQFDYVVFTEPQKDKRLGEKISELEAATHEE